jgi:hypothetical protein
MPQFLPFAVLLLGFVVILWAGPGLVRSTRTRRRTVHRLQELRRIRP